MKTADIQWDEKGLPCSVQFEDKYFCEQDGLLKSEYVFCGGNNLKERFKDQKRQKRSQGKSKTLVQQFMEDFVRCVVIVNLSWSVIN